MAFNVCGVNYKTAPLPIREALALSTTAQIRMLDALVALPSIDEAVVVCTCNRTEIYYESQMTDSLLPWLADHHRLPIQSLSTCTYAYQDIDAIKHLLRVMSGLDSMMLGEPQIFGQIKQAFHQAVEQGTVHTQLQSIFQFAFSASKRIRNQSGVGQQAVSIAYAAAQLVSQRFANLAGLAVLIIGSGDTARLVAKYLHQQGAQTFSIVSRTQTHASELAIQYTAKSIPIQELSSALPHADIIISATTCPLPFIHQDMVQNALHIRQNNPMFFLDLAMPRDIDPSVGELPQVDLYNIDDLQTLSQQGLQHRQAAAQYAESLIAFELQQYAQHHRSLRAKDLICHYRASMETLAQSELQRALQQLANGESQLDVLTEFSQRLIQKFIHTPTLSLRQAALDERDEVLEWAHNLFQSPVRSSASVGQTSKKNFAQTLPHLPFGHLIPVSGEKRISKKVFGGHREKIT